MDVSELWDRLGDVFSYSIVQAIVVITLAVIVQKIVGTVILKAVSRVMYAERFVDEHDEKKRQDTLVAVFRTAANIIIWVAALIFILIVFNVNVASLLTGAGLLGIVVGFGAQNTIRDIIAGVFVIVERQYRIGDIVTLHASGHDVSGVVEDFSLRVTRLRDLDGNLHIVENGATSEITNLSFEFANVNVDVGVSYDSDIDKVEKIINKVGDDMQEEEKWQPHIYEPIHFLRVDEFEDSAIRIKALGKVEPAQQWDIAGEFRRRLKREFDKGGITIPFPQMVVHQQPATHRSKK